MRRTRVEAGCDAQGISVAELARRLGKKRQQVYAALSGTIPGTGLWGPMAKRLDCEVVWLTTGRGVPPVWWAGDAVASDEEAIGGSDAGIVTEHTSVSDDSAGKRRLARQEQQVKALQARVEQSEARSRLLEADVARLEAELAAVRDRRAARRKTPRA